MTFYELLSRYYDLLFPAAPAQTAFVLERCEAGASVLDVAAGTGNLAVTLAASEKGLQVLSTDGDPSMAERIAGKAGQSAGSLEAKLVDMRGLAELLPQRFHTVLCVGNSIPHLANPEEITDVLRAMSRLLLPEGRLILQTVNYDRVLRDRVTELPPLVKTEGTRRVSFFRSYELGTPRISFHGRLVLEAEGEEQEEYTSTVPLYPLTSGELQECLRQAGFAAVELFGSFQGEPFGPASPAMVCTARKPS